MSLLASQKLCQRPLCSIKLWRGLPVHSPVIPQPLRLLSVLWVHCARASWYTVTQLQLIVLVAGCGLKTETISQTDPWIASGGGGLRVYLPTSILPNYCSSLP